MKKGDTRDLLFTFTYCIENRLFSTICQVYQVCELMSILIFYARVNVKRRSQVSPFLLFYRAARMRACEFSTFRIERGKKARISSSL